MSIAIIDETSEIVTVPNLEKIGTSKFKIDFKDFADS